MDLQIKWLYRLSLLLLSFITIFLFWKLRPLWIPPLTIFLKVLTPFIIAAFITYLLNPLVEQLRLRGVRRSLAVTIIFGLFFTVVFITIYKGTPIFIRQFHELSDNIPILVEQYNRSVNWLESLTSAWPPVVQERFIGILATFEMTGDRYVKRFSNSILQVADLAIIVALIPFIAFYMIKDYDLMKKAFWYVTPRKWRVNSISFLKDVDKSLGSYIRGQVILSVVVGLISAVAFAVIRMEYSLLLGIIIGITNIIPYFGPLIGAVPAVIIAATISTKMVIYVIIIVFLIQFFEGSLLSPLIVGKSLQMHPLVIIFALLIGSELGGIFGLIIIVPLFAILKVALVHVREHLLNIDRDDIVKD